MKTVKVKIKTILDVVIGVVFFIILLISLSAITGRHIQNAALKRELQWKGVQIRALSVACEMDYLIKTRRPDIKGVGTNR